MSINLSFFGEEKGGFEPVPEDTYVLRVREIEVKQGQKGPYLNFKFEVADGEHAGRFIWDIVSLSEQSRWKQQQVLEAITQEPWRDENMELEPKDLYGMQVLGVVTIEAYTDKGVDKLKNRIVNYYPYTSDNATTPGKVL